MGMGLTVNGLEETVPSFVGRVRFFICCGDASVALVVAMVPPVFADAMVVTLVVAAVHHYLCTYNV